MSQNHQKRSKNRLQKGYFCRHFLRTQTHTAVSTWFSKRIHVKLVIHTGFFLYLFLKWRYNTCKTMCSTYIVEFFFCLSIVSIVHGSAVIIALCHAQRINSPIAPCVNFGLQIPPLISQDPRQGEICQFLPILYRPCRKRWRKPQITLNSDKRFSS